MSGNIRSTKHVSLGAIAHFEGTIESDSALVSGYIKDSISTKHTLVVQVPATVIGDLISASVRVASGVILNGKIVMNPQPDPAASIQNNSREEVFANLVEPVEDN